MIYVLNHSQIAKVFSIVFGPEIIFCFWITENEDKLFIDGLYQYLIHGNNQHLIKEIKNILEAEEYDTDGLEIDILLYEEHGICNMKKLTTIQTHFDLIFDYVYDNKCMST